MSVFKNIQNHWQDEIRLLMVETSERYGNPSVYQYGFFDAYQFQNHKIDEAITLIQKARSAGVDGDAFLQDAIITLLKPKL